MYSVLHAKFLCLIHEIRLVFDSWKKMDTEDFRKEEKSPYQKTSDKSMI
jgi:hypothetical protein